MSSGRSSNDASSQGYREGEAASNPPAATDSQQLLDEVLQATLQFSGGGETLAPEDLQALVAVARRRKGAPFTAETVQELVDTVLRLRFRRFVESSGLWSRMTQQVASTVMDDPRTRDRLRSLWDKLCEAAS